MRRTAELALGDPYDEAFVAAKEGINEGRQPLYRHLSNNSLMFEQKPTRERLHDLFMQMRAEGEPGFINAEAARKRRDHFECVNP